VRAVAADPERLVICAGFTQALSPLTRALGAPVMALEDPGLAGRDRTIATAGGSHLPIPVDAIGARTGLLTGTSASAMVVTPAHQFPLGVTLAPSRRSELPSWAAESGGLIIEDDYDAEFRYDRQPVGALRGLAPEHVAYTGTASKTLAPALRLGWMVLPCALLDAVVQTKHDQDLGSPALEQLTLARLIDSGAYERHLRRARRHYSHATALQPRDGTTASGATPCWLSCAITSRRPRSAAPPPDCTWSSPCPAGSTPPRS
jgi:GntR family transcriptional regulator/MocR family aminotransferase